MKLDLWTLLAVVAAAVIVLLPRLRGARRAGMDLVRQKLAAGAQVVDVRTPDEYRRGAHPRAVNIPLQELSARIGELRKDRPVVLYCASGMRSGAAARALRQAGFDDVLNAGGLGDVPV